MKKKNKKILLKVENASFSKNNKWLVKGVSLEVKQGEIVTLIGPNGSGKSTTAKIALGIYKDIEGKVNKFTNKIKKMLKWKPKIKFEEGVKLMLNQIDLWETAPLWSPKSIKLATKTWFKYLR